MIFVTVGTHEQQFDRLIEGIDHLVEVGAVTEPVFVQTSLLALCNKVCANPMARNAEPAFLAVVVGRGSLAYRRNDGVHVIPVSTLTA